MYVCMVTYIARVWINRVRLSILLVVSGTGEMNIPLSTFVPENLVSRDGFGIYIQYINNIYTLFRLFFHLGRASHRLPT